MDYNTPVISIVTVCRNSAKTIGRTFRSLLNQDSNDFESVVIDGASTDETLAIIKEYQLKFQARGIRMKIVSEKDDGLYYAMNKGIAMSQGEFVGILNSDDFYENGTVKWVTKEIKKNQQVDIIYGLLRVVFEDGREFQTYRYRYENYLLDLSCKIQSAAQHPTCFVKKSLYDKIGNFDTSFRTSADYDFLVRAAKNGASFVALDCVLSNFTLGGITDTVDLYDNLEQRWRAQYKNGLLTEREYKKRRNQLRYRFYKRIKESIAKVVFGRISI